jgi:hypothetical protein
LLVEVERLSYRRCPAGAVCIAPDGPVVAFRVVDTRTGVELHRGVSALAPPSRFPHFVWLGQSDGETYAQFSVQDTLAWCSSRSSRVGERSCWSRVASLTDDPAYCGMRVRETGLPPDACYEELAERLDRPVLCANVSSERGWCGYTRATSEAGDPVKCGLLGDYRQRGACVRKAAERHGRAICTRFPSEGDRDNCLSIFGEALREPHIADRAQSQ